MKTFKTIVVLLALIAFASLSVFASGIAEKMEKENNTAPIIETPAVSSLDKDDMISAFSYAYGYATTKGYLDQAVSISGAYWLKGIEDSFSLDDPLVPVEEMNDIVNQYIEEFYYAGLYEEVGEKKDLSTLAAPETLVDKFSYSYSLMNTIEYYYYNGLDILCDEFKEGAEEALWPSSNPAMTDDEVDRAINTYAEYLNEQYYAYMEELAVTNLAEAEAFLEDNKNTEGTVVLPSGNQMYFYTTNPEGESPLETDTVVVDYDLFLLDGQMYDSGTGVTFSLQSLIPGFTEAVTNMKTGEEALVYIHPAYGYGEYGTDSIAPNSLLIFRICLNSIVR